MILLLLALLLLPSAMLPKQEFFPAERVEMEARDASFPADARRAVIVTRTGGLSPVKTLNVKVFEKEGEYKIAHVEYIVVYYTNDYVVATRMVDYDSFEKLWIELSSNRAFQLPNGPPALKDQPTYAIRVKEIKKENSFTVGDPGKLEDKRYANCIAAIEKFWRRSLEIQ